METGAIQSLATAGARRLEEPQEGPESSGFVDTLREVVSKANEEQLTAESETRSLVSGQGDIVDTMIAIGRAEVSMKFVVSLRNRALEAYQEIMRLQV
jgi:flagellar hook-basal body complex protein FliE